MGCRMGKVSDKGRWSDFEIALSGMLQGAVSEAEQQHPISEDALDKIRERCEDAESQHEEA